MIVTDYEIISKEIHNELLTTEIAAILSEDYERSKSNNVNRFM